ncbi:MAG: M24 family metallopeptidase, partial [Planctomycetaceae bacterium]|nr:M24 family metallopeptidase [Planctomycetaceae bacterium]
PHGLPSSLKLAGQSHLLIDWGTVVNGYMSDLTRVFVFEKKNKKLQTIYETVLKAQNAAINAIKPGKNCTEIDTVARSVISDAGFGKYFNHGLGHSFGLEIHESPRFASGDHSILKPGMVMTVEPGIYLKDWGGVRIEDNILVTQTGCEVLSRRVPKSFDEMICLLR